MVGVLALAALLAAALAWQGVRRRDGSARWVPAWIAVGVLLVLSISSLAVITLPLALVLIVILVRRGELRGARGALIGAAGTLLWIALRLGREQDCRGPVSLPYDAGVTSVTRTCGGLSPWTLYVAAVAMQLVALVANTRRLATR